MAKQLVKSIGAFSGGGFGFDSQQGFLFTRAGLTPRRPSWPCKNLLVILQQVYGVTPVCESWSVVAHSGWAIHRLPIRRSAKGGWLCRPSDMSQ